MNNLLKLVSLFLFVIIVVTACDEDICKNKSCVNGVCDTFAGNCLCTNGYQTDASGVCTVEWTNKFLGTFNVMDSCVGTHTGIQNYNLNITALSPTSLTLDNLGNHGHAIEGIHINSLNFEFDETVSNGMIFKGTGKMMDTTIVISYILNDSINNNGSDTCLIKITI